MAVKTLLEGEICALRHKALEIEQNLQGDRQNLQQERSTLEAEKKRFAELMEIERQKLQETRDKLEHQLSWRQGILRKEQEEFKRAQLLGTEIAANQVPVTLEVGGEKFRTELRTLARCQGSVFPKMVENIQRRENGKKDPYVFIDRDSRHFRFILNFLRQGEKVMKWSAMKNVDVCTLQEILDEVQYYKMAELECIIKRKIVSFQKGRGIRELVQAKWFHEDKSKPGPQLKTLEAVLIEDINLSNIEFVKVEFCHSVTFKNCIMTSARFQECVVQSTATLFFDNVDLRGARFLHCKGIGKMEDLKLNLTLDSNIEIIN